MTTALKLLDHKKLINFFKEIGVSAHIPDGFRVFPTTHNSLTIIEALKKELQKLNVTTICNQEVEEILTIKDKVSAVKTKNQIFNTNSVILATGGLGYPKLGSTGDGYKIVQILGHNVTKLYPAMMPLKTKETWQSNCRANTIPKTTIKVNLKNKKLSKLKATGDLIFTKDGLRGPVILDFAREITPYLDSYKEVPVLINLTKGMNENEILDFIKKQLTKNPHKTLIEHLETLLPKNLLEQLFIICGIDTNITFKKLKGENKNNLLKILTWTPFSIIGHDGFDKAMITRGGINLKEINPNTMESKLIDNLYFAGEIIDLDGPCGGYNLQWAFSSGYLAGSLK